MENSGKKKRYKRIDYNAVGTDYLSNSGFVNNVCVPSINLIFELGLLSKITDHTGFHPLVSYTDPIIYGPRSPVINKPIRFVFLVKSRTLVSLY